jgi:hypothetical protein
VFWFPVFLAQPHRLCFLSPQATRLIFNFSLPHVYPETPGMFEIPMRLLSAVA